MSPVFGRAAAALALLLAGPLVWADQPSGDNQDQNLLSAVTVTATRLAEQDFTVPASIDTAPIAHAAALVNASESLAYVPGLIVRDRQNYAQDEQISIRGFGARAPFGIAGVRIYMDGIPSSQPDGQGEVSQFDLASAERIEVLRGPFSVLYGNSAGGVIQLFTASGSGPPHASAGLFYGSFAEREINADLSGGDRAFTYNVGASYFATQGARGHSAAQRSSLGGKWGFDFDAAGQLTVLLNLFDGPDAQDPLGLTQAQFNANPTGTAPNAALFNTRKSADQGQLGAVYELAINATNTLSLTTYGGHRDVLQFLAIPVATQKAPTSSGGVVSRVTTTAASSRAGSITACCSVLPGASPPASTTTTSTSIERATTTSSAPRSGFRERYAGTSWTMSLTSINTCRRSGDRSIVGRCSSELVAATFISNRPRWRWDSRAPPPQSTTARLLRSVECCSR